MKRVHRAEMQVDYLIMFCLLGKHQRENVVDCKMSFYAEGSEI